MKINEIADHSACNIYCAGDIHCLTMYVHVSNIRDDLKNRLEEEISQMWEESTSVIYLKSAGEAPGPREEDIPRLYRTPNGRYDKMENYRPYLVWIEFEPCATA